MKFEVKRCPKCHARLLQIAGINTSVIDTSLADKWKCPNCDYEESESYFDKKCEERFGK